MARRRSNTMGKKLKQINNQEATNDKTTQSMILQQPSTIKLIMRRTSKPSRSVQIPETLTGTKLFQIVEKEYYVEQDKQILFFKSQRIQSSQETRKRTFTFNEKDILHVHNKQLINRESVSVFMQFLNNDYVKFKESKITASPNEIIRQLLEDSFIYQIQDMDKYLYVQSGRFINISRRLFQQAIEDDSIIMVIAATEKIGLLRKLEQREMQLLQSRTKLTKRSSLNFVDQLETPDFKKKDRGHVYKSMVLPQSKEVVWEEDSNSEFSKKILLKRLTKKKNMKPKKKESIKQVIRQSQILSITSQFSSSPKHSKNGEKQTFQNIKIHRQSRLFCSEILPKKNDLLNFKPPPAMMNNDDDFDEVQQMDFGCHQNDDDEDEDEDCVDNCNGRYDYLKVSAPLAYMNNSLTKSIGKMRGDFLPVLAIDNNKSDSDDSDDMDN